MFRRNRQKLQSFTIIEVLLAMVVSTIVIGATIAIWLCIDGMFKRGMSDTYAETGAVLFISAFTLDMNNAENVKADNTSVTFSFFDKPDILYRFDNEVVTRTIIETTDTFHLGIEDVKITPHETLPNVVKSISFSVLLNANVFPVFLTKDYSNSRLFTYEVLKNEP
jgi:hypothetical protein